MTAVRCSLSLGLGRVPPIIAFVAYTVDRLFIEWFIIPQQSQKIIYNMSGTAMWIHNTWDFIRSYWHEFHPTLHFSSTPHGILVSFCSLFWFLGLATALFWFSLTALIRVLSSCSSQLFSMKRLRSVPPTTTCPDPNGWQRRPLAGGRGGSIMLLKCQIRFRSCWRPKQSRKESKYWTNIHPMNVNSKSWPQYQLNIYLRHATVKIHFLLYQKLFYFFFIFCGFNLCFYFILVHTVYSILIWLSLWQ